MIFKRDFHARASRDAQRGQAIALVAGLTVGLIAVAAVVIDTGNIYNSHQQLAAASEAAALAGAYDIPNTTTTTATTDATNWSAVTGKANARSNLQNVAINVSFKCLTSIGPPCMVPPGGSAAVNAISVTQTAQITPFLAQIIGFHKFNISATATAIPKGGTTGPANVMIVLDTTESMSAVDTNCTVTGVTNPTREQCAQAAVRTLLTVLDPCSATLKVCGLDSNGNYPNPVAQVGLMAFPGLKPAESTVLNSPPIQAPTASDDYICPTNNPSITSYNANPGYLILPLQSDYRASDTTTVLNTSSNLVTSVGGGSCGGAADPGGEGTFYAGAIAAAQSYLTANSRTNVPNYMILLSDGDANATSKDLAGNATSYPASNECHQAITASQTAQGAGIQVYTVAYGAEVSGCSTDTPTITPCATMEAIASTPTSNYFFADAAQSGQGVDPNCTNAARPISNLYQAFSYIASDLGLARLVPNTST